MKKILIKKSSEGTCLILDDKIVSFFGKEYFQEIKEIKKKVFAITFEGKVFFFSKTRNGFKEKTFLVFRYLKLIPISFAKEVIIDSNLNVWVLLFNSSVPRLLQEGYYSGDSGFSFFCN